MKSRVALTFLAAWLAACGPSATEPKKAETPPEPVTGLHALFQMFAASHSWAPDAQVYQMTNLHVGDVKPAPGKSAVWQVTFVSPSLQQSCTYTYSVTEASLTVHQGINGGKPEAWSGPRGSSRPFLIQAARTDSDQAYQIAVKKVADFAAKNPATPITFLLAQAPGSNNATWRVLWGESVGTSPISVVVDASSGAYVETLH